MTAYIVPQDFYVYVHRKATTGEIFYVGKGYGDRAWHANRNSFWKKVDAKHGHTVEIVLDGLQEWAALELEQGLIALHGRRDLGLGPLTNLSDGGEGGATGALRTKETKEKLRVNKKAFYANNPAAKTRAREKAIAQYADPAARQRTGEMALELWQNPEFRAKKSAQAHLQMKAFAATPEGMDRLKRMRDPQKKAVICNGILHFESLTEAVRWLRTKKSARTKAAVSAVSLCLLDGRKKAYGYRWAYVDEHAAL
jgi:hypothetical protein